MRRKKFWFILLALAVVYGVWLGFHILQFEFYTLPESASLPEESPEIKGVYHLHTKLSDGYKKPGQIARLASKASMDFIILTDHGNPNYGCLESEGWKEGVLVLAGSELSVNRGHLVGLGFDLPLTPLSRKAEEATYHLNSLGGFAIIAHPYSKTSWSWGEFIDYSGMEIINGDTMLRKKFYTWIPYLPALLIKPRLFLLRTLNPPLENLSKWDRLNQIHPLYGYYSSDAHILYGPLLSFVSLHIPLQKPLSSEFREARAQVYKSLKRGAFYNVVEAAAEARGFRFWAQKGEERQRMGSTLFFSSSPVKLKIHAPFPFKQETHLIHNGETVLKSEKNKVVFPAEQPGVYRVEVYLKEPTPMGERIPWILSNPIFLTKD
ncbi:hypothetical protein KGY73_10425 [bacterium]|nr:hypothetical protein [bacterium]